MGESFNNRCVFEATTPVDAIAIGSDIPSMWASAQVVSNSNPLYQNKSTDRGWSRAIAVGWLRVVMVVAETAVTIITGDRRTDGSGEGAAAGALSVRKGCWNEESGTSPR